MPVRLDALVSAIAAEGGLDPDRTAQDKVRIITFINDTRQEIADTGIHFKALEFQGELVTVANATAGTVDVTNNSVEVTGVGSAFSTGMVGSHIQIGDDAIWQRIAYVTDTTHLSLETQWLGTTTSSASYEIWKRLYALPPKVDKLFTLRDLSDVNSELAYYPPREFSQRYGFGSTFNSPYSFTTYGQTEIEDAFSSRFVLGTATSTAGRPVLDFAGSTLATALAPGDMIIFGDSATSTAYYVDRVLTNTKVALRECVVSSLAAYTATALSLNRNLLQFFPSPDQAKVFYYTAYKKVYNLFNDGDWLEEGWYGAVKKGAIAKVMGYINSPKEIAKLAEYQAEMAKLIRKQATAHNPAPRLKPYIPRRYGIHGTYPERTDRI